MALRPEQILKLRHDYGDKTINNIGEDFISRMGFKEAKTYIKHYGNIAPSLAQLQTSVEEMTRPAISYDCDGIPINASPHTSTIEGIFLAPKSCSKRSRRHQ